MNESAERHLFALMRAARRDVRARDSIQWAIDQLGHLYPNEHAAAVAGDFAIVGRVRAATESRA